MKNLRLLVLASFFFVFVANVFAQEKLTKEEWQNEINRLTEKKVALTNELNSLKTEIANLKKMRDGLKTYDQCIEEFYASLGFTKADIENFRKNLNELSAKIDAQEGPKADRQAELDAMKKNKISALQEFFDKVHNQLQRKLDAWIEKPKDIDYTVVKGDHLWGIAKKKEHYANPFAWPMIYQSNRDQIKNPDLIFPKQIFKIPNLTEEEKAKYDKIRRNYKPAPAPQTQETK
ncbi:MAG: LysM peptidoglycan-binding domain-containing protein [Melioribacteraceae bacterium]|nr:LysM peptidoglycan-binding domain-containing protein [Melioribacteraceae bacterium]